MFKQTVLCTFILFAPLQARAEGEIGEGLSLLEQGAQLFMKGLSQEMQPALRELRDNVEPAMRGLAQQLQPMMHDLLDKIDDLDAYHLPEKLPNGDIIIRRKSDSEILQNEGEIEI